MWWFEFRFAKQSISRSVRRQVVWEKTTRDGGAPTNGEWRDPKNAYFLE